MLAIGMEWQLKALLSWLHFSDSDTLQFMPPMVSGASGEWMDAGESGVFLINAQGKRVSGDRDSEGHRIK